MHPERRLPALLALTGGILAIAWSAIFVRWSRMPGVSSAFYRMVIAIPVLWAVLPLSKRACQPLTRRALWVTALGGAFFAGDVGFWNVAVMHTSAGNATFLSNISPLFVGLFTWALTKRLPSHRFWTALLVSFAGSSLIVAADLRHGPARSSADVLAVVAAVCFALYLVITGSLRGKWDAPLLLALSTTASALTLLAFAVVAHISLAVPGVHSMAALLGLGLVCQVGGYYGLTYALGHLPATVASILWLTIAPLTAAFAWILFGEKMSPLEIAGGLLIIAGVWIVARREKLQPKEATQQDLTPIAPA
jgi:drug/metabolite transporter (DMT)-like permease